MVKDPRVGELSSMLSGETNVPVTVIEARKFVQSLQDSQRWSVQAPYPDLKVLKTLKLISYLQSILVIWNDFKEKKQKS